MYKRQAQGRPCLLGYIEKCSAPCVGRISQSEHRALAQSMCDFLEGKASPILRQVESEMRQASAELDFETAAKKRDDLRALETVLERNTMVLNDGTDADIFALVSDELDAAVHVFHVRGGRIRGTRGWVVSRDDDASEAELMARLFEQIYSELPDVPEGRKRRIEQAEAVSVDDAVSYTHLFAWLPGHTKPTLSGGKSWGISTLMGPVVSESPYPWSRVSPRPR